MRRDPVLDLVLLRRLAAAADEDDRPELAGIAQSLVQALDGSAPGPAPTLTPLPGSAWSAGSLVARPGIDRVLQTLAPYLEPLFPVQLERYGITESDRVRESHAPELHRWVERVRESLGSRPLEVYLASAFRGAVIEATRPPTLVVGADAIEVLGQAGVQWLVSQRVALSELGFSLAARFSPSDVTALASLAALYVSAEAPVSPADRERLGPFLEALRRVCPEQVGQGLIDQAPKAARDLLANDPLEHDASANARADRLALLLTGDLRAALSVIEYLERTAAYAALQPWELPSSKSLIAWALSDEYLALRRSALGKPKR